MLKGAFSLVTTSNGCLKKKGRAFGNIGNILPWLWNQPSTFFFLDRVRFFWENPKTDLWSQIIRIMVHQRNWRIKSGKGFGGSFNASRSEWFEITNPFLDSPKKTHPICSTIFCWLDPLLHAGFSNFRLSRWSLQTQLITSFYRIYNARYIGKIGEKNQRRNKTEKRTESEDNNTPPSLTLCSRTKEVDIYTVNSSLLTSNVISVAMSHAHGLLTANNSN